METTTYAKIANYIDANSLGVVSTIDEDGTPYGSVVHLCTDRYHPYVYFITKNETHKFRNLASRPVVGLTVFNARENSTLQAKGRTTRVEDSAVIDAVSKKITRAYAAAAEWLPPIAKLHAGAYEMVQIEITEARLAEYHGASIGDTQIFTQA